MRLRAINLHILLQDLNSNETDMAVWGAMLYHWVLLREVEREPSLDIRDRHTYTEEEISGCGSNFEIFPTTGVRERGGKSGQAQVGLSGLSSHIFSHFLSQMVLLKGELN